MERAKPRALNVGELIQAAESLAGPDAATSRSELYKTWIAFNEDHPLAHLAYFNYSVSLRALGDIAGALGQRLADQPQRRERAQRGKAGQGQGGGGEGAARDCDQRSAPDLARVCA